MIPSITAAPGRSVKGTTLTVCKGDSVRFYWGTVHGVASTTAANWKSCSLKIFKNLIGVAASADQTLKMNTPGTQYIYCQVPGHCISGQKMKIVVKPTAC
jgi:plastocyanin